MNKVKIELPEQINGNMQININVLSSEYQVVMNYRGYTYNCFNTSLPEAFEYINRWIEKLEMEHNRR